MKSSDSALHPTTFFNVDIGDVRKLEYIMAINNPLGPRQTRCEKMDSIVSKKNDR